MFMRYSCFKNKQLMFFLWVVWEVESLVLKMPIYRHVQSAGQVVWCAHLSMDDEHSICCFATYTNCDGEE